MKKAVFGSDCSLFLEGQPITMACVQRLLQSLGSFHGSTIGPQIDWLDDSVVVTCKLTSNNHDWLFLIIDDYQPWVTRISTTIETMNREPLLTNHFWPWLAIIDPRQGREKIHEFRCHLQRHLQRSAPTCLEVAMLVELGEAQTSWAVVILWLMIMVHSNCLVDDNG